MSRKLPTFDATLRPEVHQLTDLGLIVRNRRALDGLRIDDAASLSGVSSDVLSRLENGKSITTDKLMHVLDALGLKVLVLSKEQAMRWSKPESIKTADESS